MQIAVNIIQVLIALGIYNVWLLNFGKSSEWRGGNAQNMREEFAVYGLPYWFMIVIGVLKVSFATALLLGVWFSVLTTPAAIGMAVLMLGAVSMHIKVKDPPKKALPSFSLLVFLILIALLNGQA